jgi:F-type H+-transporting ATPase subunit delta
LLAHHNVARATVTSATSLSTDTLEALAARLSGLTGKKVQLDAAVDPAIIGGIIARVGNTVYDGSIRMQLAKMKQRLLEA